LYHTPGKIAREEGSRRKIPRVFSNPGFIIF